MENLPIQTGALPIEVGAAVLAHCFYNYQVGIAAPRADSDEDLRDVLTTVANHTGVSYADIRRQYGSQVLELISELSEFMKP